MRHWAKIGLIVFFLGVLATYTGFSHGTNYAHYTRYPLVRGRVVRCCMSGRQLDLTTRGHDVATSSIQGGRRGLTLKKYEKLGRRDVKPVVVRSS